MVSIGRGHPTKYVVLFKRGFSYDMEEEDWNLEQDLDPDWDGLGEFARGELNGRPLWLVLLCRTCREQGKSSGSWIQPCTLFWWRNSEYEGPIPPLRDPATELVCSALTRTADIKERMRMVEAEAGPRKLIDFVTASLFPPWAEGAEAGLKERLARIALVQVNWWEVRAALGIRDPNFPNM